MSEGPIQRTGSRRGTGHSPFPQALTASPKVCFHPLQKPRTRTSRCGHNCEIQVLLSRCEADCHPMNFPKSTLLAPFCVVALGCAGWTHAEELHSFKRIQLSDQFWSEGANFGDLNNDGKNDLISGPWWWEGPDFT